MRSIKEARKIFHYVGRGGGSPGRDGGENPGEGHRRTIAGAAVSDGFMASVGLLEETCDHLIERRILNAHVDYRVLVEDGAKDFGHTGAIHLEFRYWPFLASDLAEEIKSLG